MKGVKLGESSNIHATFTTDANSSKPMTHILVGEPMRVGLGRRPRTLMGSRENH
jgi:hypothetical protein